MPQSRKTRQQKIQHSQRKVRPVDVEPKAAAVAAEATVLPLSHNQEIAETQRYVVDELKRIGWISLLCAALLLMATVLLADFAWTETVRGWLPF